MLSETQVYSIYGVGVGGSYSIGDERRAYYRILSIIIMIIILLILISKLQTLIYYISLIYIYIYIKTNTTNNTNPNTNNTNTDADNNNNNPNHQIRAAAGTPHRDGARLLQLWHIHFKKPNIIVSSQK